MQSYGGRIADDAGKTVTIKSEETRTYLTWLKDAWDKGIFPPGNTTWDGAGDNQAYLSGQAAFIANTGSVGIAAKNDDPELFEGSAFSPLPAGPKGTISPITPQSRAISEVEPESRTPPRRCIEHLAQPGVHERLLQRRDLWPGAEGPGEARRPSMAPTPILAGLLGLAKAGTAPAYPDVYNAAYADLSSQLHHPEDGAARRRRRLGFRRGDGRGPGRRARRSTTSTECSSRRRSAAHPRCRPARQGRLTPRAESKIPAFAGMTPMGRHDSG